MLRDELKQQKLKKEKQDKLFVDGGISGRKSFLVSFDADKEAGIGGTLAFSC